MVAAASLAAAALAIGADTLTYTHVHTYTHAEGDVVLPLLTVQRAVYSFFRLLSTAITQIMCIRMRMACVRVCSCM